ncbi:MAG: nuclear transport factor 2 family protein [Sphingobacteriales bacterium]|nr:nuclear transport factor 2 family protein [Sphingobacteriales bacterium]MBI3719812.1 nuclear transport factor 2 family protein [Sphingobacteriales bacterium]
MIAEQVRTTQEVANRMNELFKENKWMEVQQELFADDVVSIEPEHAQGLKTVTGKDALRQKAEQFNAMVEEMHGGWCSEPLVGGNHISFAMGMDVTMKGVGRTKMEEVCVYEVKDGKVVKEQFFY